MKYWDPRAGANFVDIVEYAKLKIASLKWMHCHNLGRRFFNVLLATDIPSLNRMRPLALRWWNAEWFADACWRVEFLSRLASFKQKDHPIRRDRLDACWRRNTWADVYRGSLFEILNSIGIFRENWFMERWSQGDPPARYFAFIYGNLGALRECFLIWNIQESEPWRNLFFLQN